MLLQEIVDFLDDYLGVGEWEFDSSSNGLQVEASFEVEKVAFAVDACMETFRKAAESGADMLVTHHGIVWGGLSKIAGIVARRIRYLFENSLSLYSAHLPLDAHPKVGNNVLLLKAAGFLVEEPFGFYKGRAIGFCGRNVGSDDGVSVKDVAGKLEKELDTEVKVFEFGHERVFKAGAVSGRGAFALEEAAEKGLDLLITGEAEHSAYHTAKELGINVIFAGHYATETLGVKALMDVVEKLGVEVEFIDVPTGL